MTTRDEYVAKLKSQLDRWNADMAKWETQAKSAQADAKKRFEQQLVEVRAQREKALYQLRLLEGASAAAWKDFTRGADQAWDQLRATIEQAATHFQRR